MKNITIFTGIIFGALLTGCAGSTPPAELLSARASYQRASTGTAAQLVPAELHKAQVALTAAEASFQDDASSYRTRDLAYVADRKARTAEALATTAAGNATSAKAKAEYEKTQTEVMNKTKQELAASELAVAAAKTARIESDRKSAAELAASERAVAAAQQARFDAEKRAAETQAALSKLAEVKEEARGLVITLSGSIFFASNQSALLPSAQGRLAQVAEALMATKERNLTIEGHTDSQGTTWYNQELSLRRADAVRSFLVARGYPGDLIKATGIGEDRPVADNGNAEGRANNRRVEIIVDHPAGLGSIDK